MTDPGSSLPSTGETKKERCVLVSYPKVVFFYPLMFTAFVCCFLEAFSTSINLPVTPKNQIESPDSVPAAPINNQQDAAQAIPTPLAHSNVAGSLFVLIFLINILVISFDFPGVKAIAMLLGGIAIVLGLLLLNQSYGIFVPLKKAFQHIHQHLYASPYFYLSVGIILFIMVVGGILVNWFWNIWIVESNRLIHVHGLLRETTEYPVIDLQVEKKIVDVFEYLLLWSGTLTFRPNPTTPPIVLENIPRINRKEQRIQAVTRDRKTSRAL